MLPKFPNIKLCSGGKTMFGLADISHHKKMFQTPQNCKQAEHFLQGQIVLQFCASAYVFHILGISLLHLIFGSLSIHVILNM